MITEFIEEMLPLIQAKKLARADQNVIEESGQEYAVSMYWAGTIIRIDIKPL